MIISDEEVERRINSPFNLINKLRHSTQDRKSAMELFTKRHQPSAASNPPPISESLPQAPITSRVITEMPEVETAEPVTTLDAIIQNHETQIKLGLAHDNAINLLNNSVNILAAKLDDVKASQLPSVINTASAVIERIRRERNEVRRTEKDKEVHYHFYTPQQKKVEDYEVIDVTQ
jgi:hypothetical protein